MKIVFPAKHGSVLCSPGVFSCMLINCGPECHNDQGPGFALGQLEFCSPWVTTTWVSGTELRSDLTDGIERSPQTRRPNQVIFSSGRPDSHLPSLRKRLNLDLSKSLGDDSPLPSTPTMLCQSSSFLHTSKLSPPGLRSQVPPRCKGHGWRAVPFQLGWRCPQSPHIKNQ